MAGAGQPLRLRIQTKMGPKILEGLFLASTIDKLKESISEVANIPKQRIKVRQGYPPKVIDITDNEAELSTLPFRSGDTLIVEEDQTKPLETESASGSAKLDDTLELDSLLTKQLEEGASGILTRKVVPADNSCLFTSTYLVMNQGAFDTSAASELRSIIASIVSKDPATYTEAFLGKPNKDYCAWIRNPNSWGGGIELFIMSQYFSTEIAVVDTQSGRVDRFGEDKSYEDRVFVIYDGIHYDPLVYEAIDQSGSVATKFSIHNAVILAQALELASEAKSIRQFTDVEGFSLRCLACQAPLRGQREAQNHATTTGHINFGEY